MRPTLFSALQRAANFTVRGAAITLGSTMVSCTVACYIERGAHQMVYRYFPHKYANVEWANGLTQEQLDDVRGHNVVVTEALQPANDESPSPEQRQHHHDLVVDDALPLTGSTLWNAAGVATTTTTNTTTYLDDDSTTKMTTTSRLEATANKNTTNFITSSSSSRFWKEQEEQIAKAVLALPLNEIQACAMTC